MDILEGQRLELEILKPFVKSTVRTPAGLMLELDWDRNFERLLLSSKRMSFSLDSTQMYVAAHTMVSRDAMDDIWKCCFTKLLGTGVALKSTGLVWRKHTFVVSSAVRKITEMMSDVSEDSSLAESLNGDAALTRLISEVSPDVFTVDLSVSTEGLPPGVELRTLLTQPRDITWTAVVERYVTRGVGAKKLFMSIIDMIDIALAKAIENSKRLRGSSGKGQQVTRSAQ